MVGFVGYTQAEAVPPGEIRVGDWILPDGFSEPFKVGKIIRNPTYMHAYEFRMRARPVDIFPTLARYSGTTLVVRTRKASP